MRHNFTSDLVMKRISSFLFVFLFSFFAISIHSYAEEIRICNSCGYELYPATAKFCGNCGVSAAGTPSAQQDVKQQSNTSDTSQQDVAATEQEELTPLDISLLPLGEKEYKIIQDSFDFYYHKAGSFITKKLSSQSILNAFTCYFYLCNAEAMLRLLPNTPENTKKLNQITSAKRQINSIVPKDYTRDCPRCEGDGFTDFHYLSHDDKVEKKENSVECTFCFTRKTFPYVLDHSTLNRYFTKAKFDVFEQTQSNANTSQLIEQQITTTRLTVPQKAAYAKAMVLPCEQCFGFKIEQCRKCDGLGLIKCNDNSCNNGYKKNTTSGSSSGSGGNKIKRIEALKNIQKCKTCDGTTFIECNTCKRRGAITCTQCHGTGSKDICKTCDGVGYLECTRCKKYANQPNKKQRICTACSGKLLVLCKTCDGAGVK